MVKNIYAPLRFLLLGFIFLSTALLANAQNIAPVAIDDTVTTAEDTPLTGNVTTNDSDADGPGINITDVSGPANGTITLNADGTFTYTPNSNFYGNDTISYSYCDGGTPDLCDTAILVISVSPVNDPPVAADDNISTPEDVSVMVNVLANDADPEGNIVPTPSIIAGPSNGTASVNPDGSIAYTPTLNFNGNDTLTYVICDNGNPVLCDTAILIITVTPVADAPDLTSSPVVTDEDVSVTSCFSFLTDNGLDSVSVSISCGPTNGTVDSMYVSNGAVCIVYSSLPDYNGPDETCITLCDLSNGLCVTKTIPITVNPVEDLCYWIKGFSPNSDGQNDKFYINCNDGYANATLQVFSRWGDEVWRSDGHYNNDWKGTNMANAVLPDGTYYYIYKYNDGTGRTHAGFTTITR